MILEEDIMKEDENIVLDQTWALPSPWATYGPLVDSDWPVKGQLELQSRIFCAWTKTALLLF